MLIGGCVFWMVQYGVNQMAQQRFCSLPTMRHARIVNVITAPCFVCLSLLASFVGLVALVYFDGCDPLMAGRVRTKDQIVIYFAVKVLGMEGIVTIIS